MGYRGIILLACCFAGSVAAATINVPADQSTIQAAINAANAGDTVLVAPGTYYGKLNFNGKAITVTSSGGAAVTVLDGQGSGPIVTFATSEGNSSILQGFTLTHANNAAVKLSGSVSPSILDNVFVNNTTTTEGAGIAISGFALAPLILRNSFSDNNCGGVNYEYVVNIPDSSPIIEDNVFVNNHCVALNASTSTFGITTLYNNTFVGNSYGLIIFSATNTPSVLYANNLVAFNDYGVVVDASAAGTFAGWSSNWSHNLVYGSTVADFQGDVPGLANPTGTNGNISADPALAYWAGGDVHLLSGSPAIDAGDTTVGQASATDVYGDARVLAGNIGGLAVVDIGADEATSTAYVPPSPAVINVPADEPTIQAAINAASDGDIVVVAPGTYYEQIDYLGKAVTVKSSGGPAVTILDGNNSGPIVTFKTNEGKYAILQGFTLTHARNDENKGAAVYLFGSVSPTIEDNIFVDNLDETGWGAAISGFSGFVFYPTIVRNYFTGNSVANPGAGTSNTLSVVYMESDASPLIADNVFANNSVIAYYQALFSGGQNGPKAYNNTFIGNLVGLELSSNTSTPPDAMFTNNLLAFNQTGVEVSLANGPSIPQFSKNLVYGNTTADYQGVASQTGTNGNISADPLLKDWAAGDAHLLYGSPAIDVGSSSVSQVSATDFYGDTRVAIGNPNGSDVVDIGAVEYFHPVVSAVDGNLQVLPNITKTDTLESSGADSTEPLVFAIASLPAHGTLTLTDAATGAIQYVPAKNYLGADSFTFTVTDPYGTGSNSATEQVTVADIAPTANDGSVGTTPGYAVEGTLLASLGIVGQVLTFSIVSQPAHGFVSITNTGTGAFTYTPAKGYTGSDAFKFKVTDQYGTPSNTATVQITIAYAPPVANAGSVTTTPDIAASGKLSAMPGFAGEVLTFSLVSNPTHGTVTLTAANGQFRYSPKVGYAGSDSFTFQVTDGAGTPSDVATVSVTANDVAPKAAASKLRASSGTSTKGPLDATKAYIGQTLTFSVVSAPAHGTVTITNPNTGAYTYTPAGRFTGSDSFTFRVMDQWGTASTAVVKITVL